MKPSRTIDADDKADREALLSHTRSIEHLNHSKRAISSQNHQDQHQPAHSDSDSLPPLSPIITNPGLFSNQPPPTSTSPPAPPPPSDPLSSSSSSSSPSPSTAPSNQKPYHHHHHHHHHHHYQNIHPSSSSSPKQIHQHLPTIPPSTHQQSNWRSDTKNFRIQGWDPILIISQILTIQALHYIILSILIPPMLYLFANQVSLEYEGGSKNVAMIIDWRAMVGLTTLNLPSTTPINHHHILDGWAGFGKLSNSSSSLGRKPFRFGNRLPNINLDSGKLDSPIPSTPTTPTTTTTTTTTPTPDSNPTTLHQDLPPDQSSSAGMIINGEEEEKEDHHHLSDRAKAHSIRSTPATTTFSGDHNVVEVRSTTPLTSSSSSSGSDDHPPNTQGLVKKLQVGLGSDWLRNNLDYDHRDAKLYQDISRSWVISFAWFLTSMIGVIILYEIVRRPKQIMDHSLTICLNHLILTIYYSKSIPSSLWFYFVLISSSIIQILIAEQLCVRREFKDGLGIAWKLDH